MNEPAANAVAIVLAAGKSTRMKSDLPKVLHELCGLPLLTYVLKALDNAGIRRKVVVVGHGAELVRYRYRDEPGVEFVLQEPQLGTGHAVQVCESMLRNHRGPVLVLVGDAPFVRAEMLRTMLERTAASGARAFLATAVVADPFGMGRIVREATGRFLRIVEQKDASPDEAAIHEINPSFYVFDGPALFDALHHVRNHNAQREFYLTDVPGILRDRGALVLAEVLADATDMYGINHRRHLSEANALMQTRIQERLFDAGVTIVDGRNTYIDARARIGRDTIVYPFSVIGGPVTIGSGCRIGPFAHVREGTTLADGVLVGSFVEVVRSELGSGTIAKHLAYLGDSVVGRGVTVGAGVITANNDGKVKSQTRVADGAFLGCGSVLIAPVEVGSQAMVGAGAVVTKNHHVADGEQVLGVPARPSRRSTTV
jgi:bifunctional UDP-N-acetylglucosamine pyrophosphorylase/glucosamine-1-phosphate N-acetyltransferase